MLVISPSIRNLLSAHKRTLFAVVFVFLYSFSVTLAVPPATQYAPGETIDPSCAPSDTNCSVQILPDQTSNANKYLTTDGSSTAWSSSTLVLGGNFTTTGNYATTLTATGTTALTLPTTGTLYGTATGSITSAQLLTSLSDETGTGLAVFNTAPSFTTSLSTPSILTTSGALNITPASGSNVNITLATAGDFTVNTNQLFVDTSTGSVGVGTGSPAYKLQVQDASVPILSIGDGLGNVAGERVSGTLFLNTNQTGTTTDDIRTAIKGIATDFNNTTGLTFHTSNGSSLGAERMRITSTGSVGVGTTTPTEKLEVVGNIKASGGSNTNLTLDGTDGGMIKLTTAGANKWDIYNSSSGNNLVLYGYTGTAFSLYTNAVRRFDIDSSGNIIISDLAGSGNRCLYADATGQINAKGFDCGSASGGDNLGDHTATQNILLGSNWLSGDGGNEGIKVDTSGNVGIGVASPSYTLDVAGAINVSNGYQYQWGDGTTQLYGSSLGTSDYIVLQTNAAERMRIDASGNVGIGTTSPQGKLVVSNAGAQGLEFLPNATYGDTIQAYNRSGAAFTNLAFISAQTIFRNASAETMRIDASGNVGIGTASPGVKLEVNGAMRTTGSGFTGTTGKGAEVQLFNDTAFFQGYDRTADVFLPTYLRGNPILFEGGNIGVGTATPGAALEVYNYVRFIGSAGGGAGVPTSGKGLEFTYDSNTDTGYMLSYNRSTSAYKPIIVEASSLQLNPSSGGGVTIGSGGGTLTIPGANSGSIIFYGAYSGSPASPGFVIQNQLGAVTMSHNSNGGGTGISGTLSVGSLLSCGGIQTNGSGTMSCTSDERLKDVQGEFTEGLEAIREINPIAFSWKTNSGLYDDGIVYYGFSAQNVQAALPDAISMSSGNRLQVSQLTLMAAAINAIKELDIKVQALPEFEDDESLAQKVADFLRGIATRGEAIVDSIKTKDVDTENIQTDTLCVGSVCVSEDAFLRMVENSGSYNNTTNTPDPDPTPEPDPTPDPTPSGDGPSEDPAPEPDPEPTPDPDPTPEPQPEPEPTPEPEAPAEEPVVTEETP